MTRPTKITINLQALAHNLKVIRKLAPKSAILAMVKSNAYGHGLERIALALPSVEAFGVACLEEGTRLREAGVKNPIVLLEGLFRGDELDRMISGNFTPVIHQLAQVKLLENNPHIPPLSVWLKINTGMHRLGFSANEVTAIYNRLMKCPAVKKPIGLMTHFAESEAIDGQSTQKQIDLFNFATKTLEGPRSLANSGGILGWPSSHADWVRPGIMLYGSSPFPNRSGKDHGLKPVMSLTSEIIAIHQVKKNERIGYGGIWSCPEDMLVGIVAMGYGDGYPRHAKNGTPILVNGKMCPLIGRVSMDMLAVDLRSQPKTTIGAPVVLWGEDLPVEIIAAHSDTIGYELLTRITQRVHVEVIT